jgi:hypothetical protein
VAYDISTLQSDIRALSKNLGANLSSSDRDTIMQQLGEIARQVRALQANLSHMASDRQADTALADGLPFGKAVREDRVGLLRKAITTLLGPNGGQKVYYEKGLASRLLAKGLISQGQHRVWKLSGFLPESVNIRDAAAGSFIMARPA